MHQWVILSTAFLVFLLLEAASRGNAHGASVVPSAITLQSNCSAKYSTRRFLTKEEVWSTNPFFRPAILYSMPGSGNTWSRLLIEHATGIHSGSFYADPLYKVVIPRKLSCSPYVATIKAHPVHYHQIDIVSGRRLPYYCTAAGVPAFYRFLVVLRDPFDAIWAEYVRDVTIDKVGHILLSSFKHKDWHDKAMGMARDTMRAMSVDYVALNASNPNQRLLVRYEDLRDPKLRAGVLRNMVNFLSLPVKMSLQELNERLECAFPLSDEGSVHRTQNDSSVDIVSKSFVYKDRSLVCRMWAVFGRFAVQYGYSIWNNISCGDELSLLH